MDQLKNDAAFVQSVPSSKPSIIEFRQPKSNQRVEGEPRDCIAARKLQKADREKLRRDRLNEHFLELGNTLDPDRPKNDKATILTDTIQLLKDLTSQVTKLKAEYDTLTEESREQLTQEKNDLKEEKASLKSDIDNLNIQYQQRVRTMFPWATVDHSVVMAPPYPFPVPIAMPPPGAIPMHPSMPPFPFFGNQNHGVIHNPCSTFVPYMTPNTMVEQQSTQHVAPPAQPGSRSHSSGKQDSKNKSSGESKVEKTVDSNDVATDLELKTPGSTADQDLSSGQKKLKKSLRKENSNTEGSHSSRCSSSYSAHDSSSNSIVGGKKADDLDGRND
ncbi:transcription factor bHLH121 isoform X1 [Durio zibethinus]|uniref:Transcription factor bHLH121 isoform X1 n=1 Tax=Durio zibethinus TaxID=66656 RepID=A0A6P5XBG1_DURZI|nr:transcription factor bHLH121 isoform X1 [Durio zibethinus]XP_022725156.1 transcription factor bHLH121 isoform X1 [Durio zibethinus]XP_022725157.1 transcription factor bHLH121 isoform X1 [Durio zibethinus]